MQRDLNEKEDNVLVQKEKIFEKFETFRIRRRNSPLYDDWMFSIFNAIKAPKACFEKFGKPHTNVNTIRFVLNCSYGFDLHYLTNSSEYF